MGDTQFERTGGRHGVASSSQVAGDEAVAAATLRRLNAEAAFLRGLKANEAEARHIERRGDLHESDDDIATSLGAPDAGYGNAAEAERHADRAQQADLTKPGRYDTHSKDDGNEFSNDEAALIEFFRTLGSIVGEEIERQMAGSLVDKRWLAIAKTDLQTGIMAAIRSVAKPTTF